MSEDVHDLTARRGEDDPVAAAFRRALDAGRPAAAPRDATTRTTLAAVQARATRRHRRRLATGSLGAAAVLAAALAVVPAVLPDPAPTPPAGLPTATAEPSPEPTEPSSREPGEVDSALLLQSDELPESIRASGVEAQFVDLSGELAVGGLCEDQVLPDVPRYEYAVRAIWTPSGAPAAGARDGMSEVLMRWDDPAAARAYLTAVAATAPPCTESAEETGPYELLEVPGSDEGAGEDLAAVAELGPGQWRVRVVTVEGPAVVSLSADVTAPDRDTATVAVGELAQVAAARAVQR